MSATWQQNLEEVQAENLAFRALIEKAQKTRDAALELESAQSTAMKLCVEACQRIAHEFADASFDGVTIGAIEDAVSAAHKLEAICS